MTVLIPGSSPGTAMTTMARLPHLLTPGDGGRKIAPQCAPTEGAMTARNTGGVFSMEDKSVAKIRAGVSRRKISRRKLLKGAGAAAGLAAGAGAITGFP